MVIVDTSTPAPHPSRKQAPDRLGRGGISHRDFGEYMDPFDRLGG